MVGTAFGTPAEVALKAPRRGSVLVAVVFNFGLEENILPVFFYIKKRKQEKTLRFKIAIFY